MKINVLNYVVRYERLSHMVTATVSHFEQKFKRKDQARVMLNYYLAQKVMRRVERTLYVLASCLHLPCG